MCLYSVDFGLNIYLHRLLLTSALFCRRSMRNVYAVPRHKRAINGLKAFFLSPADKRYQVFALGDIWKQDINQLLI